MLWDKWGSARLAEKKLDLGSSGFAGQYQQRPAHEAGGILKRDWWRYYDPKLPLPDFRQWSC